MSDSGASAASVVRLVLSDVDGTLVNSEKVLTERTHRAIARLREVGILFAITTSRPPRGCRMIHDALQLTTPISGFNGGLVVSPDFSHLAAHRLEWEDAHSVLRILRVHGFDAWLHTPANWYVTDAAAPHVQREQTTLGFAAVVIPDFEPYLAEAVKIVGVSDDPQRVARCQNEIQEQMGRKVSARTSQSYYLDITHPQANKGRVVDMLCEMYGIETWHIASIGDMPADVLMFEESGISFAMGNASDEVKAAATFVTASCDEEGFAKAMERITPATS